MSNTRKKKVSPALLETGEAIISQEIADKYKNVISSMSEKLAEEVGASASISEVKESAGVINSEAVTPSANKGTKKAPPRSNVGAVRNGAIGSKSADAVKPKKAPAQPAKSEDEKTAIFSTKNVTWAGVGKVFRGYNIVPKQEADKWLTRSHVRLATPEEVAGEFGKK